MPIQITEAEIIAAIRAAAAKTPEKDGFTRKDVATLGNLSDAVAAKTLSRMLTQGLIVPAKIKFVDAWGHVRTTCGYRLAKPVPAKRAARR